MKKKHLLNQWLWKWHFIAGIISLPIVILLSATGMIYLFKDRYEKNMYESLTQVTTRHQQMSFQQQWDIARKEAKNPPNTVVLPTSPNQATEFISGKFSGQSRLFVNPHNGTVTGTVTVQDTDMHAVRKLHGELLLGKYGTKVVELVASWMIVLILTGIYIWWPKTGWKLKGLFNITLNRSKRMLFRNIHAVTGFWFSLLLLLVLAGGLPWTDVFGSNFKWLQEQTNTGYPHTWNGRSLSSEVNGEPLTLDSMVAIAKQLNLKGEVSIHLPQSAQSVFSVSNNTSDLSAMRMAHFDQYSGKQVLVHTWSDIGPLMQSRLWVMAFHQGEFGAWNWYLMLGIAFMLLVMSVSAVCSYLLRKKKGSWSVPKVPAQFSVGSGVVVLIIILGVILPLFGVSVLVICLSEWLIKRKNKEQAPGAAIEASATY